MARKSERRYPKIGCGSRRKPVYVLYPVELKNGAWAAAEVLITGDGGYISPEGNPAKTQHATYDNCMDACRVSNKFHFGSSPDDIDFIDSIVAKSMALSKKAEERAQNVTAN